MPEIVCKWCKNKYAAYNNGRKHCNRIECKTKEIESNLQFLKSYFEILINNNIIAKTEIRCPGNDSFGSQIKAITHGNLNGGGIKNQDDPVLNTFKTKQLTFLTDYFRPILWKGLKGNFIITTEKDGTINPDILNESFTNIETPIVLGNNKLITKIISKGGN